jgi:excinuclease ABC subunit A
MLIAFSHKRPESHPVKKARAKKPDAKANTAIAEQSPSTIQVRGARVHNLKNIDVDLPRDCLVVLTGVSGSGKSTLAFDTIYAEGQRRYLECLSSYARQFLDQLERPEVDSIEGLPPTVAIDQRAGVANPRSTLGTVTEIHDYLRLLFARAGIPHCPNCGLPIERQTPEQMVERIMRAGDGRKVQILAPLVRDRKGEHADVFQAIRRGGLIRARVDGEMIEVTDKPPSLAKKRGHTIEAIVDRIAIREGIRPRLAESLDLALKLSGGGVLTLTESPTGWDEHFLSTQLNCPACGAGLPEIEPRSFTFNSPHGACPVCEGLGIERAVSTAGEPDSERDGAPCPGCGGSRLRPEALAVRIDGRSIHDLSSMAVSELLSFFQSLAVSPALEPIARPLITEIASRLAYLAEVGVAYLSLSRGTDTLSGGELQRARLASQLGSGLVGVCTILDEPTAGLHPRDTARLIAIIRGLLEKGNSVVVVEHDESVIRAADWLVDLGPGAGPDGGQVVAAGTLAVVSESPASVTGKYLGRPPRLPAVASQRLVSTPGWIEIHGAAVHNLEHINTRIPLGAVTCVTGVSGSGKSTLVHEVLARAVRRFLRRTGEVRDAIGEVSGLQAIDQLVEVDQCPIGRGPRSTPATATGVFNEIRRVFALTREAKVRGYRFSRFSFNAPGGRCEACKGLGRRTMLMRFLPDLRVTCDECGGKRFNRQTLEIRFKGKSIGDVLEMRVDESREFFGAVPRVLRGLDTLRDVGLGYVTLGQSSTTLSGGEAQRVKLAAELGKAAAGRALYLLDEPTTGLHFADIDRLLAILHRLADLGHAVVVIEHQLDVIATADWVIDLGPDAGTRGGRVVAAGPPGAIALVEESHTGRALRHSMPNGSRRQAAALKAGASSPTPERPRT